MPPIDANPAFGTLERDGGVHEAERMLRDFGNVIRFYRSVFGTGCWVFGTGNLVLDRQRWVLGTTCWVFGTETCLFGTHTHTHIPPAPSLGAVLRIKASIGGEAKLRQREGTLKENAGS